MADINVTPEIQNARMPPNLSREERMAFMANHVEAIQKLNPEADMKLETNWWKTSVNLGADIDVGSLADLGFRALIACSDTCISGIS
jgi:hypothetical protein